VNQHTHDATHIIWTNVVYQVSSY